MLHAFREEMAQLADRIEQEFFRIERSNRWASAWINGLIAGLAVGLIAWAAAVFGNEEHGDQQLLLFACLGSSAASVVLAPVARSNSLRSIILAYLVSAVICVVLFPLTSGNSLPLPVLCLMAVTLSVCGMQLLDAMHPAAVGSALAFVIFHRDLISLGLLLLAIVGTLTVVKVLAYIYREELRFRHFPREFRRQYYGTEVTISVEPHSRAAEANAGTAKDGAIQDMAASLANAVTDAVAGARSTAADSPPQETRDDTAPVVFGDPVTSQPPQDEPDPAMSESEQDDSAK